MGPDRVAEVMKAAATKAEAPDVRFQDLRHFSASALIRKGLSVKVVQARLGHASAVDKLDVCGHLWPDDEVRTRQAVDELLGGELAEDWLRTEAGEWRRMPWSEGWVTVSRPVGRAV